MLQKDQFSGRLTEGRNFFRSLYLMSLAVFGIDNSLTGSFDLAFPVACIFQTLCIYQVSAPDRSIQLPRSTRSHFVWLRITACVIDTWRRVPVFASESVWDDSVRAELALALLAHSEYLFLHKSVAIDGTSRVSLLTAR